MKLSELKTASLSVLLVVNELFICCIKNTAFCNFDSSIINNISMKAFNLLDIFAYTEAVYMKHRGGRLMCCNILNFF